jgi:hypothetical protein
MTAPTSGSSLKSFNTSVATSLTRGSGCEQEFKSIDQNVRILSPIPFFLAFLESTDLMTNSYSISRHTCELFILVSGRKKRLEAYLAHRPLTGKSSPLHQPVLKYNIK